MGADKNIDMERELAAFKDPKLAQGLIRSIQALAPEHANLMEVCGTHTVSIARNGIRALMPEGTRLLSGPGCPVCVTPPEIIDSVLTNVPGLDVTIIDYDDDIGSTSEMLDGAVEDAKKAGQENVSYYLDHCTPVKLNEEEEGNESK